MKKNSFLILGLTLVLCTATPFSVYAQDINGDDLVMMQETDFEKMIAEILSIKSENPELTEDEVLKIMDEQEFGDKRDIRGITDIWNSLTESEKRLCIRYPFDALKVNTARKIATEQTERKFGYSGLGDRSDAFRHGIWNAEMSILLGSKKAELFATAHEDKDVSGDESDMLCRIAKRNFIPIETEVFWEGEHLSEAVESMNNFDVIFLDIEMGQADGITVARKIRETDKNVLIIYVTSHESYMQESFSVRPFRFLVKPVEEKQIAGCLEAAYEEISSADSYFRYSYQRLNCKIPMRDILYFESKRRKVYIVTEKETFEFYGKLNEIEESLRASKGIFLRIHQSFLINYKHIKGLAYDFAVMDNEERLSISEDRRKLISKQYCAMEDTFYVGM